MDVDEIARRAYELYEQRGRGHGNDVDDWLQAETEIRKRRFAESLLNTRSVKGTFFDASALVKLAADEDHSATVRKFVNENVNLHTNFICYAEAFGVLKRKWRASKGRVTFDAYFSWVSQLVSSVRNRFNFDEIELLSPTVQEDCERFGRTYTLDLADVLQLVTILSGTYSRLGPNSATVLVTADHDLARAARAERVRVWRVDEPLPPWA